MKKYNLTLENNRKGITLIALVLTIIVLLILAGVTIATLTGDNGILTRASDAKIETAVATVKEALKLEQGEKIIDEEEFTPEILLLEGKVQRTVQQGEDEKYYMYYALKDGAYEGMQGLGKGNIASLKDVFLIDDNLNVKYIASDGKEYGDNIDNKILEDETEIRFSSKAFSEYVSKISGATEDEMKFKWMKNQTNLVINDAAIDSLEDLVFFPNLTELSITVNYSKITSMDGVENCSKLETIYLYGIFNIDDYSSLGKLKNFKNFSKYFGNDYENIINGLKLCENLKMLTLYNVPIDTMSRISELSNNIEILQLRTCNVEKIKGLDNKINIKNLSLKDNRIKMIDGFKNLVNLTTLDLSDNNITDITPLSANTSLMSLNLKGNTEIDGNKENYVGERLEALNKIGEILDRGGTININLDKLNLFTNYKTLDLSNQNITTLEALEGLTELTSLNLSNNKITLEDEKSKEILGNMDKLKLLNLDNNDIKDISMINKLKNLKRLFLGKNNVNLVEIEDIISNLDSIRVSTESLKTIENCSINKITKLLISSDSLTEIPDLSKFVNLTEFSVNYAKKIANIENISKISSLKKLGLSNCDLHNKMIDFSKLTNLTNLDLSGNTLWSEDLENLKALKNNTNLTIDLSNNSIIDASALLELNPNTKIHLTKNVNLSPNLKKALTEHFGSNVTYDK